MRRRSDNPMMILALGILLMASFGVALVLLTDKTPVLRLRPELEEQFKIELRTRFRSGGLASPAALELILSRPEAAPQEQDTALAEFALARYIALAGETEVGTTSVSQVEIRVEDSAAPRFVLTRLQLQYKQEALAQLESLVPTVTRLGFKEVQARVGGYSKSGARILIECLPESEGPASRVEAAARRAVGSLQSRLFIGSIELRVGGPHPLVLTGGRDTPLHQPRPPRRRPSPAPVNSATRRN